MSGLEIERKFLIRKGSDFKSAAFSHSHIKQGYMPCQTATVRVRTIKSHSDRAGLSRYEFEKEITNDEAEHLFELCRGGVIDKCRWLVKSPDARHTFEVDEFFGDNEGLVVAEVELSSEDELAAAAIPGAPSIVNIINNNLFFMLSPWTWSYI